MGYNPEWGKPSGSKIRFFFQIHVKDGLPNEYVYGILEDDCGRLWMSTNKGISCYDPAVRKFGTLPLKMDYKVMNLTMILTTRALEQGSFFFWRHQRIYGFHPDSIKENKVLPKVVIANCQYLEKEKDGKSFKLKNIKGINIKNMCD
ncbi:MAG: hypothetical protein H6562_17250 [Lewinellaceae bacterium]|nr:hypothetical protein [Lewinellaceae bacterium]